MADKKRRVLMLLFCIGALGGAVFLLSIPPPPPTSQAVFPSVCPAGQYVTGISPINTIICAYPETFKFASSTFKCSIASTSLEMTGFGSHAWNYTPSQSGRFAVTVDFVIWHPPGDHDANYTLMHGTSAAPSCAAAATGTAIGNTFSTSSSKQSGVGNDIFVTQHETVYLSLTIGTFYWFDLRMHIETADSHMIFNPQITVIEA